MSDSFDIDGFKSLFDGYADWWNRGCYGLAVGQGGVHGDFSSFYCLEGGGWCVEYVLCGVVIILDMEWCWSVYSM